MALTTDERLTLFEHIDELRKRLTVCAIALCVGVIIAAIFNSFVFGVLLHPLQEVPGVKVSVEGHTSMVATGATLPAGKPAFSIPSYSENAVTFKLLHGALPDGSSSVAVNVGDTAHVTTGGHSYALSSIQVVLPPSAYKITTFSPAEPFMTSIKIWAVAGLILASPLLIWELWAFVGPAFTATEKKYFYPVVISSTLLFLGGIALAYFLVLPKGLSFLLTFSAGNFNVQNRASDYLTFSALFVLAFGLVFEMPVILVLLARVGVVDNKFLRKHRRWAILILAVAAAVITPSQDAFSMLAMFIPLVILYEISIWVARFVEPKGMEAVFSGVPDEFDDDDDDDDETEPAPA
jgi:sec-independent protein translocase protein TatC